MKHVTTWQVKHLTDSIHISIIRFFPIPTVYVLSAILCFITINHF